MKLKYLLLSLCLILNLTVASGQIYVVNNDTLSCFTKEETLQLHISIIELDKCLELRQNDSLIISNLNQAIDHFENMKAYFETDLMIKDAIIHEQNSVINVINKDRKKLRVKNKLTQIMYVVSAVAIGILTLK